MATGMVLPSRLTFALLLSINNKLNMIIPKSVKKSWEYTVLSTLYSVDEKPYFDAAFLKLQILVIFFTPFYPFRLASSSSNLSWHEAIHWQCSGLVPILNLSGFFQISVLMIYLIYIHIPYRKQVLLRETELHAYTPTR